MQNKYTMQRICVHCGREQYAPAVYRLSTKGGECPRCGKCIDPISHKEYKKRILKLKEQNDGQDNKLAQ